MKHPSNIPVFDVRLIAAQEFHDDAIRRAAEAVAIRQSNEYFGRVSAPSRSILGAVGSLLIRAGTALQGARLSVSSGQTSVSVHS